MDLWSLCCGKEKREKLSLVVGLALTLPPEWEEGKMRRRERGQFDSVKKELTLSDYNVTRTRQ